MRTPSETAESGERGDGISRHPDLEVRETLRGARPGDRFVRIVRHRGFKRLRPGYIVPREGASRPAGWAGRLFVGLKRLMIGRPIPTAGEAEERLGKFKALAVLSSDALSSVAYGTEEIMKMLVLAGLGALSFTLPIALLIVLLLAIVVASYRQTIGAYPSGGGSYIVAGDNLGRWPGLTAAAALMIDYLLNVAVCAAAGAAAITSLVPDLLPYTVPLAVGLVGIVTWGNLRGVREAGTLFAAPVYVFVGMVYLLVGWGLVRLLNGDLAAAYHPPESAFSPGNQALGLFLLMSAFAQGCSAMTGVEAVSNGVTIFKKPETVNARITTVWMGVLLGTMFLGVSFLATSIGVLPAEEETVLSQIGRVVFGAGPVWAFLQIATTLILCLSMNTSFADFPRLASILARDRFLPRLFQFRGDRLAFTTGILALAALAVALVVAFRASVDALIPLFAIGVFVSFTLSQAGMVVRWRRDRTPGWQRAAAVNGLGAVATAVVSLVIGVTKFTHGAWVVVLLIPALMLLFNRIHDHYDELARCRRPETPVRPEDVAVRAVVPVADTGVQAVQAVAFAAAIAGRDRVVAVHVTDDAEEATAFGAAWHTGELASTELVVVVSPYRSLLGPLLAYVDALKEQHPRDTVTVVLPEFVPSRWWEHLLHNQTALRIKAALLFHPGIVVVSVPYHLGRPTSAND